MKRALRSALLCTALASAAGAQSLARQVTSRAGLVQVIYASRAAACGDGETFIGNVYGHNTYYSDRFVDARPPCVHGPARVVVDVVAGAVSRLHPYVGPVPASDMRTLNVSPADAVEWLSGLVDRGSTRLASDAMLPLVLASGEPWAFLLRVARDDARPTAIRRNALTWLAGGVAERLGLGDAATDTDADDLRKQVVFALSQRPKSESVPELIDLARTSKYPAVRRSAIFWLGQTGDPRGADLYAELLGLR